jgi:hypothetical protein
MSYLSHHRTRRTAGSAELLYLLVVVAAGAATFWWAGHQIGMDLSSLATVASVLGIRDTHPPRYDARAVTHSPAIEAAPVAAMDDAPYCNPGQTPAFGLGLAELQAQLGETMGTPVECEHGSSTAGDSVQQTTTGLAAYNKASNTLTFTDGWRHWALRSGSVLSWEGTQSDPPMGQG